MKEGNKRSFFLHNIRASIRREKSVLDILEALNWEMLANAICLASPGSSDWHLFGLMVRALADTERESLNDGLPGTNNNFFPCHPGK